MYPESAIFNNMTTIMTTWERRLSRIITVRDIFFILAGFLLAGILALAVFNFYMSSAVKIGGLVFKNKGYSIQYKPAPAEDEIKNK